MRLQISPLAETDLERIGDHIAEDNPARALSFVAELRKQCRKIAKAPLIYRTRPELGTGIRYCAHGNYAIFFVASNDQMIIERILHGAMDIEARFGESRE